LTAPHLGEIPDDEADSQPDRGELSNLQQHVAEQVTKVLVAQ
jgi:hypothetical protein